MKRLLAVAFVLAIAAASRRSVEENAAKGDWLAVSSEIFEMEKTAPIDAAALLVEVTAKYPPDTEERRAANLDYAISVLERVVRDDKYNVRALNLLSTIYTEHAAHGKPSMKESNDRVARVFHERAVYAAEHMQTKPGERWTVGFIQDQTVTHPMDPDGTLVLRRAPFTIRVLTMTPKTAVQINAAASDINFKRVRAGYRLVEDCQTTNRIPFCLGSEFGEGNQNEAKRLNVDAEGAHWVDYKSYAEHRWSKVTREGSFTYILDRDVANLSGTAIEQTTMPRLYVTVLHRSYDNGVLSEDEIRRVSIRFR